MRDSAGTPRSRRGLLSSRVARRVFLLFVLCSFLPLLLFASLSLFNVSAQLEEQARSGLHEACKSTGMVVVQRLQNLHDDIRSTLEEESGNVLARLNDGSRSLRERLAKRVEWLAVGTADSKVLDGGREGRTLPALSTEEKEHLDRASILLTIGHDEIGEAVVILVFSLPGDGTRYLYCRIRSDYLWGGDKLGHPNVDLIALTEEGHRLYSTREHPGVAAAVSSALRLDSARGQVEASDDGTWYLASYRTMFTRPSYLRSFIIVYTRSRESVLAPIASFERLFLLFGILTLCTVIIASLIQIRRSMVPINVLTDATQRIQERDFSTRVEIATKDEFRDLGESFNGMAESLENYDSTMDALNRIGVALTAERSSSKLNQLIVESAHRVTTAALVMLHLVDESGRLRSHHVSSGSVRLEKLSEAIDLQLRAGSGSSSEIKTGVALAASTGRTINIEDVRCSAEFDPAPYRSIEELLGFRFRSVLCAPMKNHEGEIIGVLQLVNATDKSTGAIGPFSLDELQIAESLASQAAVALTKNRLVDEFQNMFEALTELIATAIDEKSKYTGDHCRRVPILTMMVAEEVCAVSSGPCADLNLTPEELYELKVAALLHDCGKVTTPVHIMDKATKLEKLFDRIELIDTRFEVVKRDLQLEHLQRSLSTEDDSEIASLTAELAKKLEAVELDREVLHQSNIGREFMTDETQATVREIGTRYEWTNSEGQRVPFLTDDEIENLCVTKGTLTATDRHVINYHVVATINMLNQLPFPKNLSKVPEIAGAHHEKMDGTGYPVGLKRSEITLQGRILGIADVFEALTAKDRPYKPGKTLSETLHILGTMKENGHIDPDLFQLFVESGVYLRYSHEFLDPEQIDEVDLATIPGYTPGAAMAVSSVESTS